MNLKIEDHKKWIYAHIKKIVFILFISGTLFGFGVSVVSINLGLINADTLNFFSTTNVNQNVLSSQEPLITPLFNPGPFQWRSDSNNLVMHFENTGDSVGEAIIQFGRIEVDGKVIAPDNSVVSFVLFPSSNKFFLIKNNISQAPKTMVAEFVINYRKDRIDSNNSLHVYYEKLTCSTMAESINDVSNCNVQDKIIQ
ncbi:MAG: hypothetical protein WCW44_02775 [archaeon]|jgi:hypothetical protein